MADSIFDHDHIASESCSWDRKNRQGVLVGLSVSSTFVLYGNFLLFRKFYMVYKVEGNLLVCFSIVILFCFSHTLSHYNQSSHRDFNNLKRKMVCNSYTAFRDRFIEVRRSSEATKVKATFPLTLVTPSVTFELDKITCFRVELMLPGALQFRLRMLAGYAAHDIELLDGFQFRSVWSLGHSPRIIMYFCVIFSLHRFFLFIFFSV